MRWNHTVNSKESCWLLWRSRFCDPRMTPLEESFWLLLGLLLRRVILTLYKDLFWLLQGSFETTLRRVKKQINSSKELFWPLFWVICTPILGHFYSYFGSFLLLFWVICTPILGHFYSYYGSFQVLFWVIPTLIRHHFNPYPGNFKVSCKGKIAFHMIHEHAYTRKHRGSGK